MGATMGDGRKHSFVLSGGGGYAAYEVGVMKALAEGASPCTGGQPLDPSILTGTSAGAFNAAFLAARSGMPFTDALHELEQTWLDDIASRHGSHAGAIRVRGDLFHLPAAVLRDPARTMLRFGEDLGYLTSAFAGRVMHALTAEGSAEERAFELIDFTSIVSFDGFQDVVRRRIDPAAIADGSRQLVIAVTSWDEGKVVLFDNEGMRENGHEKIIASAAIPGVAAPVVIDGRPYADGGVLLNAPLKPALRKGADVLHVIYLDPDPRSAYKACQRNSIDTFDRLQLIQRAAALNHDIETADDVNRGLEALDKLAAGAEQAERALEAVGVKHGTHRHVTIHRYHPKEELGSLFGALDVGLGHVRGLLEKGYQDAVQHDCKAQGCAGTGM